MDVAFLIRRLIALLISLIMSFVPYFYEIMTNNYSWLLVFSHKEVFFSLSAIMILCFCDIIEIAKKLDITLTLICFFSWFIANIFGIFNYVTISDTDVSQTSQRGNIIFTIVTIAIYSFFNVLIAKDRKQKEVKK